MIKTPFSSTSERRVPFAAARAQVPSLLREADRADLYHRLQEGGSTEPRVARPNRSPFAPLPAFRNQSLVERYDAVKFSIFQRKSANFRGLVLFCIEADFCNQIL